MGILITAAVLFVILSILILVHEFGHFITAKKFGILVEEFGIGLPPRIWGKKIGETIYSVNWLPIGGFVRLYGEDQEEGPPHKISKKLLKRAFFERPIAERIVVLVAGVSMNFLLALVLISFLFTQGVMVPAGQVHIESVTDGSPAALADLKPKDIIKEIQAVGSDGQPVNYTITQSDELVSTVNKYLDQPISFKIQRDTTEFEVSLKPRKDAPSGEGPTGVVISDYILKRYSVWEAPVVGLKESLSKSYLLLQGIAHLGWKVISRQSVSSDVAGPIGIAVMTNDVVKLGILPLLEWVGLLSLNLAIVNVLPIPALDGGRLLFVLIELFTGKRVRAKWERHAHMIGMAALISLIILISINDIIRYIIK